MGTVTIDVDLVAAGHTIATIPVTLDAHAGQANGQHVPLVADTDALRTRLEAGARAFADAVA
ncbi:MAG: hypothetical protein Q4F65_05810 [Propionibacteriaceae bacterium]|nr:hypothetical protein [Propionibacteriaceae bacterium]